MDALHVFMSNAVEFRIVPVLDEAEQRRFRIERMGVTSFRFVAVTTVDVEPVPVVGEHFIVTEDRSGLPIDFGVIADVARFALTA